MNDEQVISYECKRHYNGNSQNDLWQRANGCEGVNWIGFWSFPRWEWKPLQHTLRQKRDSEADSSNTPLVPSSPCQVGTGAKGHLPADNGTACIGMLKSPLLARWRDTAKSGKKKQTEYVNKVGLTEARLKTLFVWKMVDVWLTVAFENNLCFVCVHKTNKKGLHA